MALRALGCFALGVMALMPAIAHAESLNTTYTNRYMVQFSDTGSTKFRTRDGSHDTSGFYDTLHTAGITSARPAVNFTSDIFHGTSFVLEADANTTALDHISSLPEVSRLWPVASVYLPITSDSTPAANSSYAPYDPHVLTGVDDVHALGHDGAGIVVGIVDTGVDYTHPALGGCFGAGCRVAGGYDLVGDAWVAGAGDPAPDDDPRDCLGHGTHVSGILGMAGANIVGVAPAVTMRMYKVFGCSDGTYEDIVAAGFVRAYEDGVDVITASLGSAAGFPDTPLAVVATEIQAKGVFVSIAAGNSGSLGPFYTSDGGNAYGAMAVGSVQATSFVGYMTLATSTSNETREIAYLDSSGGQWNLTGDYPAFFLSDERNVDACFTDLPGFSNPEILVLPRSDNCVNWQVEDSNIKGKVDYVFYYNFEDWDYEYPSRVIYDTDQAKGFALISYTDGDWLVSQWEAGHNVSFSFVVDGSAAVTVPSNSSASVVSSDYSSWGPTNDGRMKPEISAPGGRILSTWTSDGWAVLSGTSMATPYIAGVAALWLSVKGGRDVHGTEAGNLAHNDIVASGKFVLNADGSGNYTPIAQLGAGIVDAYKAIIYDTTVSPSNINLNDTDHFASTHTITVLNSGSDTVTYNITHEAGISFLSTGNPINWVSQVPQYQSGDQNAATVDIVPTSLVVSPGSSATFTLSFTEPAGMDAALYPVYGGAVSVIGSNGETVKTTYLGIKGSLYNATIWETARGVPLYLSPLGGLVAENQTYNFAAGFQPEVELNVLWGTREFSFDLVNDSWAPGDWAYPPVPGEAGFVGSLVHYDELNQVYTSLPITDYPRSETTLIINPAANLSTGDPVPDGRFRILGRALRNFGDKENIDDWVVGLSAAFVNDNSS